ncbi:MAG: GDP-mannose 4,6-dehydratase [Verrucomicrobiales bacterium]|nr:GDP-mannose 4,6-dehydratase [Verrucomicrobiales bacterium]
MADAIIFGGNGQDGFYLNQWLNDQGLHVISTSRKGEGIQCDVSSFSAVEELVRTEKPTYIFHLAASSTTRHDTWSSQYSTITGGTWNVLESVKLHSPESKVFITGSGLQFENTGEPISETCKFEGSSPYSVARISSVYTARYYQSLGLKVYIGYLFHHESARRPLSHVSKKIAHEVALVCSGQQEQVTIGCLTVEKEWAFAGDIVEGIWTLVCQDEVFEAVIGTGEGFSIEDWINECFAFYGEPSRGRILEESEFIPEYTRLISNPSTIQSLGWRPKTGIKDLVAMFMESETNPKI